MCQLVMAGVSGYRGDAAQAFRARRLVAGPAANPVCEAMPADATRLEITDGMCSCAFYGVNEEAGFDAARERERYERKGWSAVKIERALAAKLAAHDRPARETSAAAAFVAAIQDLVEAGARVTLLAHDFAGRFDEPFEIVGSTAQPLARFLETRGKFPPDTLVAISA